MVKPSSRSVVVVALALVLLVPSRALAAPEGQMTWALHFSLAPTLFEPAETPGVVSPPVAAVPPPTPTGGVEK